MSTDGNVQSFHHGGLDIWVCWIDNTGSLVHEKCFGGSANDFGKDIVPLADGSFIISGTTNSTGGDIISNHGSNTNWLCRIDSLGNIIWSQPYGTGSSFNRQLIAPAGTDRVVLLSTGKNTSGITSAIPSDFWLATIDNNGVVVGESLIDAVLSANPAQFTASKTLVGIAGETWPSWPLPFKWVMQAELDTGQCSVPNQLVSDRIEPTSARLNWWTSPHGVNQILRGKAMHHQNWTYIDLIDPDQASLNIYNLNQGIEYVWQVAAICDSANPVSWGWSAPDTFTATCSTPEIQSADGYIDFISGPVLELEWFTPYISVYTGSRNASYHIIYREAGTNAWTHTHDLTQNGSSQQSKRIYGVSAGATYEVGLSAICDTTPLVQSAFASRLLTVPLQRIAAPGDSPIEEGPQQQISISPNPTTGPISIVCEEAKDYTHMELLDYNGAFLLETHLPESGRFNLVLPNYSGIFFLHLYGSKRSLTRKVMKY